MYIIQMIGNISELNTRASFVRILMITSNFVYGQNDSFAIQIYADRSEDLSKVNYLLVKLIILNFDWLFAPKLIENGIKLINWEFFHLNFFHSNTRTLCQ